MKTLSRLLPYGVKLEDVQKSLPHCTVTFTSKEVLGNGEGIQYISLTFKPTLEKQVKRDFNKLSSKLLEEKKKLHDRYHDHHASVKGGLFSSNGGKIAMESIGDGSLMDRKEIEHASESGKSEKYRAFRNQKETVTEKRELVTGMISGERRMLTLPVATSKSTNEKSKHKSGVSFQEAGKGKRISDYSVSGACKDLNKSISKAARNERSYKKTKRSDGLSRCQATKAKKRAKANKAKVNKFAVVDAKKQLRADIAAMNMTRSNSESAYLSQHGEAVYVKGDTKDTLVKSSTSPFATAYRDELLKEYKRAVNGERDAMPISKLEKLMKEWGM
ncbi:hypothetical protein PQC39_gp102 [Vibrio phage Vp_R1]|uniref:Uncharacterized protein n=1 Tax=Vibrio phage Vp_R1 TaxID=2059867 RepID=A0A2H5BQN3_9CAUD|nr:hypothetical protein PQC39_gp102 [Vibrio phage Vp_R1]AUG88466.1 hypothetical protein VPR_102 [Vibrio phage Vp_R1]